MDLIWSKLVRLSEIDSTRPPHRCTDRQIDRLVYELDGLTEEEIGIVE